MDASYCTARFAFARYQLTWPPIAILAVSSSDLLLSHCWAPSPHSELCEGVELGCHDVALQGALALASTCSALRAPCPGRWLQSARRGHWGHWNCRDRVLWRQGPPGGYLITDRQTDRRTGIPRHGPVSGVWAVFTPRIGRHVFTLQSRRHSIKCVISGAE